MGTTQQQDRYPLLWARRCSRSTVRALQNVHVSAQTVRNRLHEGGYDGPPSTTGACASSPTPCSAIGRCQRTSRLAQLPLAPLCSSQMRFTLSTCDRRDRVWRRRGELYAACNIIQHGQFGGWSVMVWGGISLEGRPALFVLARGALTAFRSQNGFLLMHDNARPHEAEACRQFLHDDSIDAIN